MSTNSLRFDGGGQRVNIGDPAELAFERTDAFSISCWYKPGTLTPSFQAIWSKTEETVSTLRGYALFHRSTNVLRLQLVSTYSSNRIIIEVLNSLPVSRWTHIVVTYDGSSTAAGLKVYLNGVLTDPYVINDNLSATMVAKTPFNVGCTANVDNVELSAGQVDDLAIYDKELSAAEVTTIYGGGDPVDHTVTGPTANLVGYWDMGDTALTTLATSSSVSTLFDGVDEYVVVGDVAPVQFDRTDPFSVAFWFKTTTGGTISILGKLDASSPNTGWEMFTISGGKYGFQLIGTAAGNQMRIDTLASYNDGQWHHMIATWDGDAAGGAAGAHIYIDGVDQDVSVFSDDLTLSTLTTTPFQIGARDGANIPFPGSIDDVAIYDKELSAAEVATIYGGRPQDLTSVGPTGNLVGYWLMGDGDTFPTITDNSANSNDGTMTNMESGDLQADVPGTAYLLPDLSASGNDGYLLNMFAASVALDAASATPGVTLPTTKSLLFDGVDEYVDLGDVAELSFERTDTFSLSCWFKSTSTGWLVGKAQGSGSFRGVHFYLATGAPIGSIHLELVNTGGGTNGIDVRTNSAFNDGDWHHVVATYDGSSSASGVSIYVDGVQQATTTVSDTLSATILHSDPASIAARGISGTPNLLFTGNIDWVSVYDIELTADEARALYNGHYPPDQTQVGPVGRLVGYWLMGDPTPADFGISTLFGGGNEYVTMGNAPALGFDWNDAFSYVFWMKTTYVGTQFPMSKTDGSFVGQFVSVSAVGELSLYVSASSLNRAAVRTNGGGFNDGEWHHVVMTYDGSGLSTGITIYVDGAVAPSTGVSNNLSSMTTLNSASFNISGRTDGVAVFTGSIDDAAVYDKELSAGEVTTIYNSGSPPDLTSVGPTANLVGYWLMGDGDTFPTTTDQSVSGNDGTLTNMESGDFVQDSPFSVIGGGLPDLSVSGNNGTAVNMEAADVVSDPAAYASSVAAPAVSPTTLTVDEPGTGVMVQAFGTGFVVPTLTLYFKMRGRDTVCSAGQQPAYVYWVVQDAPDLTASQLNPLDMICGTDPLTEVADIEIAHVWLG